ncbi:elongation of very long chain fatty acids protein 6-like [Cyanistes caeruleus]|uniref:elongation of very long chain fatty acids protein 6-like n=1 Tax=Cyanistes caeruleus TaxID=156563 RepID=UPI000CDB594A|nr:elongation of very long chain fatty acids protein 6-like [Cyanistes caeruleus]
MLNMEANVDPSELQPLGEYDFEKNFNHLAARKWMEENCRSGVRIFGSEKEEEIFCFLVRILSGATEVWLKVGQFGPFPDCSLFSTCRQKSFIFAVIYFIVIFGIQHFMKERRPFNLRTPLILWSFSLSLFSLFAAFRVWKQMAFLLLTKGFKQSVCSQSFYIHPVSKLWMYLFALSKLVEMGDTLFIVLRKKKLMFIHWYHHLLTMIMSWYGYKIMAIGMGWNAALNLSIHFVMYLYYTVTAMGFRVPRSITMLITTSQMVQMTGFVIMNIFIVFWMDDKLCQTTWTMLFLSSSLYTTLLALFSNFFVKAYLSSNQKSKLN